MSAAASIRCDDVDDLDKVEAVTVECYHCDPDNPLAVPRETCPTCRGTGRAPVDIIPIMREIRSSKTPSRRERPATTEDDLFLEY